MLMGRKVLEALIVYQKVNVQQTLIEATLKPQPKKKGAKAETTSEVVDDKKEEDPEEIL
jgi:hypothetical protein